MKHETQNEKLAKSQNQPGIKEAFSGYHQSNLRVSSIYEMPPSVTSLTVGSRVEAFTRLRKQGGGFLFAKGPPGCSHSPGHPHGHPPENKAGPPIGEPPDTNQIQQINTNQKSNYYKLLNFKIMKKQILFIVVFVLAAFANVTKSYGQVCTPSATNPNAGHAYTYSMTNTAGTGAKYDWYVTKDANLVTAASILTAGTMFTVDGGTPYHDPATGIKDITLTWTAAAIMDGGPFYLVLRYSETTTGTAGCTVENMRVTEIKPVNSFLLAFEGGTLVTGSYVATTGSNTCAANITAAAVTAATPSLLLTYGQNTLYYVATASGINGAWYPQIQLPALPAGGTQVYVTADWTATMAGTGGWNTFGVVTDGATHDLLSATAATATEAGSPILIRIVIDNVNYQTLADQGIQVGLDGYLPPSPVDVGVNKSDITSASNCTELADFGRKATYTINKRPTPTASPAFIAVTNP